MVAHKYDSQHDIDRSLTPPKKIAAFQEIKKATMEGPIPLFPPFASGKGALSITIAQAMQAIVSGATYKTVKDIYRLVKDGADPKVIKALKQSLPAIRWQSSGLSRKEAGITGMTGVIFMDIDHVDRQTIKEFKSTASENEKILMAYRSASGSGMHIIMDPQKPVTASNYSQIYRELAEEIKDQYGLVADTAVAKISQPSFLSYDSKAYIREDIREIVEASEEINIESFPIFMSEEQVREALDSCVPAPETEKWKVIDPETLPKKANSLKRLTWLRHQMSLLGELPRGERFTRRRQLCYEAGQMAARMGKLAGKSIIYQFGHLAMETSSNAEDAKLEAEAAFEDGMKSLRITNWRQNMEADIILASLTPEVKKGNDIRLEDLIQWVRESAAKDVNLVKLPNKAAVKKALLEHVLAGFKVEINRKKVRVVKNCFIPQMETEPVVIAAESEEIDNETGECAYTEQAEGVFVIDGVTVDMRGETTVIVEETPEDEVEEVAEVIEAREESEHKTCETKRSAVLPEPVPPPVRAKPVPARVAPAPAAAAAAAEEQEEEEDEWIERYDEEGFAGWISRDRTEKRSAEYIYMRTPTGRCMRIEGARYLPGFPPAPADPDPQKVYLVGTYADGTEIKGVTLAHNMEEIDKATYRAAKINNKQER